MQALRLAILLFRTPHGLLLVDEPELSLHPAWQRHVARWFLESERQAVVATHSPELLDAWTDAFLSGEAKLFVLERGSARAVDVNRLQAWLKEGWQVGDLYRTGNSILGGWPG